MSLTCFCGKDPTWLVKGAAEGSYNRKRCDEHVMETLRELSRDQGSATLMSIIGHQSKWEDDYESTTRATER